MSAFPKTRAAWRRLRREWYLWRASVHAVRTMDAVCAAEDVGLIPPSVFVALQVLAKELGELK